MTTAAATKKAEAVRAALALLASPAPGYEPGMGRTWMERIGWALDQKETRPGQYDGLWHDLEDCAGRMEEIARQGAKT